MREDLNLALWLEADSLSDWHPAVTSTEELLKGNTNPTAGNIHVECELPNVRGDLVEHIFQHPCASLVGHPEFKKQSDPLNLEHELLGKNVCDEVQRLINRFLTFARVELGQYRLELLPSKSPFSFCESSRAKISSDRTHWEHWLPPPSRQLVSIFGYHSRRGIEESTWSLLGNFLGTDRKPDLVLELLANAEELLHHGYTRASILEAVSAVEVSVNLFTKSPMPTNLLQGSDRPFRIDKFESLFKKWGFRGIIFHLVPIYFTDQEMPKEVVVDCQAAVELRQNISHNGQRQLNSRKTKKLIVSIRSFCSILKKYTDSA